jgi:hypothetical protein
MELSRGQQRLLFVVVVLALGGLGVFLLGGRHKAATSPPARPSASVAPVTSTPAAAPVTTTGGGVNIYQWLPFTQQDLTAASRATVTFAADYENWTYTEPAQAYVAKMNGLVTANFAASLQNSYATPGVAALRSAQKQVSTSSGGIAAIRSFGTGPASIMFVVDITQKLTGTKGTSTTTTPYWVTVVSGAVGWQVNDIEQAGAGNP